jgi:hypothetical protein
MEIDACEGRCLWFCRILLRAAAYTPFIKGSRQAIIGVKYLLGIDSHNYGLVTKYEQQPCTERGAHANLNRKHLLPQCY